MSHINETYMKTAVPTGKNIVANAHPCKCPGVPRGETTGPAVIEGNVRRELHLHPDAAMKAQAAYNADHGIVDYKVMLGGALVFVEKTVAVPPTVEVTSFSEGILVSV